MTLTYCTKTCLEFQLKVFASTGCLWSTAAEICCNHLLKLCCNTALINLKFGTKLMLQFQTRNMLPPPAKNMLQSCTPMVTPPLISPRGLHLTKPTSGKAIKMPIYFYNPFSWRTFTTLLISVRHQRPLSLIINDFSARDVFPAERRFYFIICRRQLRANWLSESSQGSSQPWRDHTLLIN